MTRKTMKRSAIADHLVDNANKDYKPLDFNFPDENVLVVEEKERRLDW